MMLTKVVLPLTAQAQSTGVDHVAIAMRTLGTHIRPGYERLELATRELRSALTALCKAPSQPALAAAQRAFRSTVAAWSGIEHIRFGPVLDDHRYERFVFWPDERGIGRRQIAAAIARRDEDVTSAETLAGKSVALQGLTALEVLLFGNGGVALTQSDPTGTFACRYAAAIGENLARMAEEIAAAWDADGAFSRVFTSPGPDNPVYRSGKEVTQELYKALLSELEFLKDVKLTRALGDAPAEARAQRTEFWRSDAALLAMTENAKALAALFRVAFADIVAAASPGLEQSVLFDLDHVAETFELTPSPLAKTINREGPWHQLYAMVPALDTVRAVASRAIAGAAGLSMGFNALDGD